MYPSPSVQRRVLQCLNEYPLTDGNSRCSSCEELYPERAFWDPATGQCVKECAETHIGKRCVRCVDVDEGYPHWDAALKEYQMFPNEELWD